MKKTISSLAALVMAVSFAAQAVANPADPLHISGDYTCTGFDSHDGAFKGALTLKLDEQASHFQQGFGAYQFKLDVDIDGHASTFSGYAAAQRQSLAMYFANDSKQAPTDRGVGLALISHDQDSGGNYITTLHKSYYLPDYMRTSKEGKGPGGRGTEVCTKVIKR
ncbi:hypothetical protein AUC61_21160 [Pseudomonas sp. S25]|uniref:Uncharacterized protein n=1 Tax=Pseudomonas maioricensis TaxID=1766623 RepID=A0ABS9ZP38_9PSED|nr:hypothetical protein [Pseudomonas sp. S25]MCI8212047.1 hypothetical protein [Pseudomonas sp. S25]